MLHVDFIIISYIKSHTLLTICDLIQNITMWLILNGRLCVITNDRRWIITVSFIIYQINIFYWKLIILFYCCFIICIITIIWWNCCYVIFGNDLKHFLHISTFQSMFLKTNYSSLYNSEWMLPKDLFYY